MENATGVDWKATLDENTPHSVFQCCTYPKTGGRLGNCYLLWGDELKHDYFPFVAIAGPSWKLSFAMYAIPIIIFVSLLGSMHVYNSWKIWGVIIGIVFFFITEICTLLTTLSNPGIVFRGMLPSTNKCSIRCRIPLW